MTTPSSEEVFEIVKRHLTEIVTEIDPAVVTPEGNMKELGASSLDIVEVVSCSMRELRVRVPRSELSTLKDIGGLVDLLHRTKLAKDAEAGAGA